MALQYNPPDDPGEVNRDEYKYFSDFISETQPEIEDNPAHEMVNLLMEALGVAGVIVTKHYDLDELRVNCGKILIRIFKFCKQAKSLPDLDELKPCLPMDPRSGANSQDLQKETSSLVTSARALATRFEKSGYNPWDHDIYHSCMQSDIYVIGQSLLGISRMCDMHELMSYAIQTQCNNAVFRQKARHIDIVPFMKYEYESHSVYPWKYYWSPYRYNMISFISETNKITLGVGYYLHEIVEQVISTITKRINEDKQSEVEVINELSHIFELEPEKFDIRDRRSLQYPLMNLLYVDTYHTLWIEKYPYKFRVAPDTLSKIYTQPISPLKPRAHTWKKEKPYARRAKSE